MRRRPVWMQRGALSSCGWLLRILTAAAACGCAQRTVLPAGGETIARPAPASSPQAGPASLVSSRPATAPDSQPCCEWNPGPYRFVRSVTGGPNAALEGPVGLAPWNGGLLISDPPSRRIVRVSLPDGAMSEFAAGLGRPMNLAFDGERVLVPELLGDKVSVFDARGDKLGEISHAGLDAPAAVAAFGERIYVVGFYDNAVHVLDRDGRRLQRWGGFTYPTDIAIHTDGTIFVADAYAHRIRVFDGDGTHLRDLGAKGTAPGQFNVVLGVSLAPDGTLYAADFDNRRVQIFDPDGNPVAQLGGVGQESVRPAGVLFHEGRVYIADHGAGAIDIWERRP